MHVRYFYLEHICKYVKSSNLFIQEHSITNYDMRTAWKQLPKSTSMIF